MNQWIALITSLPTETATARMRTWRALKASGAASIRDGVYLMPEREDCRATFEAVATDIISAGGSAMLVGMAPQRGFTVDEVRQRSPVSGHWRRESRANA